ncbi:hypothetical protein P3W45_000316 [Vairimorpha bombi]|jgi:arginyl-tRNA synthetase
MLLEKITDETLKEIEKVQDYTLEELRKCFEVSNDTSKPNCTFFLLKIRSNAKELVQDFYNALVNAKLEKIKDITIRGPSVSFNFNLALYGNEIISTILDKKQNFGKSTVGKGKTVLVEYSSPNIAKIFHIGHFRTTVLGNFIKKLYNFCGYKTVGINYLGDWGKQFGLVLLGYERYGSEEELNLDPIKHLFDVYVAINKEAEDNEEVDAQAKKIFEMMENGNNEKYLELWKYFREISIEKYKKLYKKIGVEFDEYSGESLYEKKSKEAIQKFDFAVKKEDGSIYLDLDEDNKPNVLKSDGTTLYLTRDISAALDRVERYSPDKMLYVVSSEQKLHFEHLFKALNKLDCKCKNIEHVMYGMVSGMSTRKGTVKFLEDIIEIATNVMLDEINSNPKKAAQIEDIQYTALTLAISTLVVMDFSAKRIKGYKFEVEKRAKNVSGTGSYIQYAHCRLVSIENKNSEVDPDEASPLVVSELDDAAILNILYKLIWFEKTVLLCLDDYEPSRIVTYLNDLCGYLNSKNNELKVKGVENEKAKARLRAFKCARIVIGNALRLLGIDPLNKM